MCAEPAKTSDADIVAAARAVIAARGLDALSLQQVAAAVGIKTPSLYKRFDDRAALLAAVQDDVLRELARVLSDAAASGSTPQQGLLAMGQSYRAFACTHARLYPLLFGSGGAPSPAARAAIAPVMAALVALLGAASALPAARTLTAFLHGFVTMELSGNFQMGGSIDEAFAFGLDAVMRGVGSSAHIAHTDS